ncbi:MAG: TonB-dependent receptor [Thermoanaerobaculia bacterium]
MRSPRVLSICIGLVVSITSAGFAEEPAPTTQQQTPATAYVEVTATRVPEDVEIVPQAITILRGDELRARGAYTLGDALGWVAGVNLAPGGDSGPASGVVEMWGLREFDAFLLVVDGVPWGGAFNPAVEAIDLTGVDRIEVIRGSAPVMYGATSFVGVIQVIHENAQSTSDAFRVGGGTFGSASVAGTVGLPSSGSLQQSLIFSGDRMRFRDDRAGADRLHLLYRASTPVGDSARFHADVDAMILRQDPASPHPRVGSSLTDEIPLDANHNPDGAHIDENRVNLRLGYDSAIGGTPWVTTLSLTRTTNDILRGFLVEDFDLTPNAHGYTQSRGITDMYLDSHVAKKLGSTATIVAGIDDLYGRGNATSHDFDYTVPLSGSPAPDVEETDSETPLELRVRRHFSGLYGQIQWSPAARWTFLGGLRLNHTTEAKIGSGDPDMQGEEEHQNLTKTRLSGSAGVDWLAWSRGKGALWLFADYRNTFKPAAVDFGPEAEVDILQPETAKSWEGGVKGRSGRARGQVSIFTMDFRNLVVAQTVNGLPSLANAGGERFQGVEAEGEIALAHDVMFHGSYSYHDARFRDYVAEFDGVPAQLEGNRLEMSPLHMGSIGATYWPAHGFFGHLTETFTGARYLNKRNTATAPSYLTLAAGIGYRWSNLELRVEGDNLGDVRPPVAESELGDAQYYRLPARKVMVWVRRSF